MGVERLARSIGITGPGDAKECLNFSPRVVPKFPSAEAVLSHIDTYARLSALVEELARLLALCLNLPRHTFSNCFSQSFSVLRSNYYPACPDHSVQRLSEHTDYGAFTLLYFESDSNDFEIYLNQQWHELSLRPGEIILLLGDMFEIWTNGKWKAPLHRVNSANRSTERQSLAFLVNPNPSLVIEPLSTSWGSPNYQSIKSWRHIVEKSGKAFG